MYFILSGILLGNIFGKIISSFYNTKNKINNFKLSNKDIIWRYRRFPLRIVIHIQ